MKASGCCELLGKAFFKGIPTFTSAERKAKGRTQYSVSPQHSESAKICSSAVLQYLLTIAVHPLPGSSGTERMIKRSVARAIGIGQSMEANGHRADWNRSV